MGIRTRLTLSAAGLVAAGAISCSAPSPESVADTSVLSDIETAEVLTVRDGGNRQDYPNWNPEQEAALDVLGAGYFSTRK
jgi:hypothetical protein